jgi:hypothetical protein
MVRVRPPFFRPSEAGSTRVSKPLVHQIADRARQIVADPRKWTQYAIARTGNNRHCEPTDAKAVRFCAYGAILRAAYDIAGSDDQAQRLADQTAMFIMGRDSPYTAFEELIAINDGQRSGARKAVLDLFEKAIVNA